VGGGTGAEKKEGKKNPEGEACQNGPAKHKIDKRSVGSQGHASNIAPEGNDIGGKSGKSYEQQQTTPVSGETLLRSGGGKKKVANNEPVVFNVDLLGETARNHRLWLSPG